MITMMEAHIYRLFYNNTQKGTVRQSDSEISAIRTINTRMTKTRLQTNCRGTRTDLEWIIWKVKVFVVGAWKRQHMKTNKCNIFSYKTDKGLLNLKFSSLIFLADFSPLRYKRFQLSKLSANGRLFKAWKCLTILYLVDCGLLAYIYIFALY